MMSLNLLPQLHVKRVRCEYTLMDQEIMKLRKQNVLNELEILKLTRVSVIHENQEIIACNVVSAFKHRKTINVMVVSKTQSGKTGSMCATIKKYLEDTDNLIPIENIYIITGVSSCEWKDQTKQRLPPSVQARVFHRCELPTTFVDEIVNKKNILIIMDEIQVAAKKGQTIYKSFQMAGLLDKQRLYAHDVKILEYTATPDGTIYDLMKWNDASFKILAEVGDRYVGSYDLLIRGRIKQTKDLCGFNKGIELIDESVFDNLRELKVDIDAYSSAKWHIIRTKTGIFQEKTIENFKRVFTSNYQFITYDRESDINDINITLSAPPKSHTFIFIKELLRCAKTLVKTYLGVVYERHSICPDDAAIIQGLVGRITGYDDCDSLCYTQITSIEKYEELWASNFENKSIRWNSKTTKYLNGTLHGINTFNDPTEYDGFSVDSSEHNDNDCEPESVIIMKFKTQSEMKAYFVNTLQHTLGQGPRKITPTANGYYESTIRSNKKVYSCDEIHANRNYGLSEKHSTKFRRYACYMDVNDIGTLEWWLIHK